MSAIYPSSSAFPFPGSGPQLRTPAKAGRGPGLAVVVLLHLVLIWALASGLAQKAIEIVKRPIEMSVIDDNPPPPPPPPKIERIKEVARNTPPPPDYVPPPEVVPTVQTPPVIQAVQSVEPPKEPVIAAPAPVAPPAPAPKPAVAKRDIAVACPGFQNILSQAMDEAFDRLRLPGTLHTQIKLRGSQVLEVTQLSGPKEYSKYLQAAVKRFHCSAGSGDEEVLVSLDVNLVP